MSPASSLAGKSWLLGCRRAPSQRQSLQRLACPGRLDGAARLSPSLPTGGDASLVLGCNTITSASELPQAAIWLVPGGGGGLQLPAGAKGSTAGMLPAQPGHRAAPAWAEGRLLVEGDRLDAT